jgi:hypothetical protein
LIGVTRQHLAAVAISGEDVLLLVHSEKHRRTPFTCRSNSDNPVLAVAFSERPLLDCPRRGLNNCPHQRVRPDRFVLIHRTQIKRANQGSIRIEDWRGYSAKRSVANAVMRAKVDNVSLVRDAIGCRFLAARAIACVLTQRTYASNVPHRFVTNAWRIRLDLPIEYGTKSIIQNNLVTRLPRNVVQSIEFFRCARHKLSETLLRMFKRAARCGPD